VLFVMPTWSAPSELWLRRMLDGLAGELSAIACYEAPVTSWRGVAVVNLGRRDDDASLARGRAALAAATERARVALVHYLPMALRYRDVFDAAPGLRLGDLMPGC
jgi:hypothetical protein